MTMIALNSIVLGVIGCSVNINERTARLRGANDIISGRNSDGTGVSGPKKTVQALRVQLGAQRYGWSSYRDEIKR